MTDDKTKISGSQALPMGEARAIARRFQAPNAATYWTDFLLSVGLGWGFYFIAVFAEAFSLLQVGSILAAAFAILRAVLFTHELAHMKKGTFGTFRLVWNALAGIPFLVPSYSYTGVHMDHHRPGTYGSTRDGEYVSFGAGAPWKSVGYVLLSVILPALLLARFLILTPLSWIVRPLRAVIWRRMSSLAIDLNYDRHPQNKDDDETWLIQETVTTLFVLSVAGLIWQGVLPAAVFWVWYSVTVTVLTVNAVRTLGAHAYRHSGDAKVSKADEFLDSVNVPSEDIISKLIAPVGLRFHATHHLFPVTPYHELPKLHAALVAELSDNSVYLSTSRKNYAHAIARLWQDASAADRRTALASAQV